MFRFKNDMDSCKTKGLKIFSVLLLVMTIVYYRITWDIFILILLLLSAYCYGKLVWKNGKKESVRFAVGLGLLGVIINSSLLFGIGTKSILLIIVLFPIILLHEELAKVSTGLFEKAFCMPMPLWSILLIILILFFLIMGCAPIDAREGDALAKHLPITVYAASEGGWNFNVSEGVGYGEQYRSGSGERVSGRAIRFLSGGVPDTGIGPSGHGAVFSEEMKGRRFGRRFVR